MERAGKIGGYFEKSGESPVSSDGPDAIKTTSTAGPELPEP
jgi:hypothetical protein